MHNEMVTARGMGHVPANKRGERGDLDIRVSIRPHPKIKRLSPFDLGMVVPVTLVDSILGGKVEVKLLDGDPLLLKVAAGTVDGTQVRINQKGLAKSHQGAKGPRGNFLCEFNVQLPKNLTSKQRDLLKEFQQEEIGRASCRER